jgi:hypothetical protein
LLNAKKALTDVLIRSAERQQPKVLCFALNRKISGSHIAKKGEFCFVRSPGKFVDEDGNAGGLNPDDYSDDKDYSYDGNEE